MFIRKFFSLFAPDGGDGGSGGGGVTVDAARTFLSDFGHDASFFEGKAEKDILDLHGRYSAAVSKHAPKAGDDGKTPYYEKFKDPTVKDWVKSYAGAYPDAEALAMKALNLEKFIGAEKAGRGVVLPKDLSKAEELLPILRKLGASEKIEGYKVPEKLAKDPVFGKFQAFAHKVGMPVSMYDGVSNFIGEELTAMEKQTAADFEQTAEKELNETLAEWGTKADENQELGRRAAAAFIPHKNPEELMEKLTRIEGALGTKFTMQLWANIGRATQEHGGHPQHDGAGGGGKMTPEGARMRITALKADQAWGAKFSSGDADAKKEWDDLHKIGYPEQKAPPSK